MAGNDTKSLTPIQKARSASTSADLGTVARRTTSITKPSGTTSYQHYAGFIVTREKNPKLQRNKRYEEFSEMLLNQPVIGASVRIFLQVMKMIEWNVKPIKNDGKSKRYAKAIEEVLDNLESGWPQIVQRSAAFVYWGFSLSEWTAMRLDSGVVGYKDIQPRSQHTIYRWQIEDDGEITGATQLNPNSSEEHFLERRRLVYAVDNSLNDDPEGLGLFRQLYATYIRIENYKLIEEIGFDTDLRGVPVVKAPLEELNKLVEQDIISEERRDEILEVYENFLKNHQKKKSQGLLIDSEVYNSADQTPSATPKFDVELMSAGGTSIMQDLQDAISRERNNIAMLCHTGFLLLGEDGAGSLALSDNKMQALFMFVESVLQDLAFVFKRDVIKPLARLNGWDEKSLPDLEYEEPKITDIIKLTEALRNTSSAFGPLPAVSQTINEILTLLGLEPIPDEEFDTQDPELPPGFETIDDLLAAGGQQPAQQPDLFEGKDNDDATN